MSYFVTNGKKFSSFKRPHKFKNDIGMPDMSYEWSKLTHEYLGKLFYDRYGLNVVMSGHFQGME